MNKNWVILIIGMFTLIFISSLTHATTTTIYVQNNSGLRSISPTQNFGLSSANYMMTTNFPTGTSRNSSSIYSTDINSFCAENKNILSAILQVYVSSNGMDSGEWSEATNYRILDPAWSETTVTFNTKPTNIRGIRDASYTFGPNLTTAQYYSWNITDSFTEACAEHNTTYQNYLVFNETSLLNSPEESDQIVLSTTRASGTSTDPKIVVTYDTILTSNISTGSNIVNVNTFTLGVTSSAGFTEGIKYTRQGVNTTLCKTCS